MIDPIIAVIVIIDAIVVIFSASATTAIFLLSPQQGCVQGNLTGRGDPGMLPLMDALKRVCILK